MTYSLNHIVIYYLHPDVQRGYHPRGEIRFAPQDFVSFLNCRSQGSRNQGI